VTQKKDDPTNPTVVETYTYDARGLMLTALKGTTADPDATSAVTFTYDGLGHITQSTQSIKGGTTRTISYTRNQIGKSTQISYPTLTSVDLDYTYTSLGQVDTIVRGTQTLADYNYFGSYISTKEYPTPAVMFTAGYDDFGRVTSHKTVNSSNVGVDFAYAYDANGNITQQDYLHRTSQPYNGFDYDDLNRLDEAAYQAGTVGTEAFNYDLLGNRQTVTDSRTSDSYSYAHNLVNEYETITKNGTPATILHDTAGNLTQDQRGYLYEYDAENRLTTIRRADNTIIASYVYDALGRRIEAARYNEISGTWNESIYRYYYDSQRMVLQASVSSGTESDIRYFVYGNYIDEVLLMRRISVSTDYYYGHDHLYSPAVLFTSTGSIVERYEYDAYGKRTMYDANFTLKYASLIIANPIGFTGREVEILDRDVFSNSRPRLEIMYYRARYYDPQTGRFMQRDPLQYIDGMSMYEYVKGNAENYVDPYGLYLGYGYREDWEKPTESDINNATNAAIWQLGFRFGGYYVKDIIYGEGDQDTPYETVRKGYYASKILALKYLKDFQDSLNKNYPGPDSWSRWKCYLKADNLSGGWFKKTRYTINGRASRSARDDRPSGAADPFFTGAVLIDVAWSVDYTKEDLSYYYYDAYIVCKQRCSDDGNSWTHSWTTDYRRSFWAASDTVNGQAITTWGNYWGGHLTDERWPGPVDGPIVIPPMPPTPIVGI